MQIASLPAQAGLVPAQESVEQSETVGALQEDRLFQADGSPDIDRTLPRRIPHTGGSFAIGQATIAVVQRTRLEQSSKLPLKERARYALADAIRVTW